VDFNDDGTIVYGDKKKYDARGRLITWSFYNKFHKIYNVIDEYRYDGNDNLIFWRHYQSLDPVVTSEDTFTYNESGLPTYISSMDHRSNYRNERKLIYDANYDLVTDVYYMNGELFDSCCYKYDSDGNQLSLFSFHLNGDTASWTTYKYNGHGELVKELCYSYKKGEHKPKLEEYTNEYEYDHKKNLTKLIKYWTKNGKLVPHEMTINKFTYY
jgi:hypothetical protein